MSLKGAVPYLRVHVLRAVDMDFAIQLLMHEITLCIHQTIMYRTL